jgi:hypothetical protein
MRRRQLCTRARCLCSSLPASPRSSEMHNASPWQHARRSAAMLLPSASPPAACACDSPAASASPSGAPALEGLLRDDGSLLSIANWVNLLLGAVFFITVCTWSMAPDLSADADVRLPLAYAVRDSGELQRHAALAGSILRDPLPRRSTRAGRPPTRRRRAAPRLRRPAAGWQRPARQRPGGGARLNRAAVPDRRQAAAAPQQRRRAAAASQRRQYPGSISSTTAAVPRGHDFQHWDLPALAGASLLLPLPPGQGSAPRQCPGRIHAPAALVSDRPQQMLFGLGFRFGGLASQLSGLGCRFGGGRQSVQLPPPSLRLSLLPSRDPGG